MKLLCRLFRKRRPVTIRPVDGGFLITMKRYMPLEGDLKLEQDMPPITEWGGGMRPWSPPEMKATLTLRLDPKDVELHMAQRDTHRQSQEGK